MQATLSYLPNNFEYRSTDIFDPQSINETEFPATISLKGPVSPANDTAHAGSTIKFNLSLINSIDDIISASVILRIASTYFCAILIE